MRHPKTGRLQFWRAKGEFCGGLKHGKLRDVPTDSTYLEIHEDTKFEDIPYISLLPRNRALLTAFYCILCLYTSFVILCLYNCSFVTKARGP